MSRVVLESYAPTIIDITRLLEGKARDRRVRVSDLYSVDQVLNTIFTRMMETEFLNERQREEIFERIIPALADAETAPIEDDVLVAVELDRGRRIQRMTASLLFALVASLAGSLIAFLPNVGELDGRAADFIPAMIATFVASLAVIGVLLSISRLRDSQEKASSRSTEIEDSMRFEQEVLNILRETGFNAEFDPVDQGYDFAISFGGKRVLVEIKAWHSFVPIKVFERTANNLIEAVLRNQATEGIIVSKAHLGKNIAQVGRVTIKFMSLREFRSYLIAISSDEEESLAQLEAASHNQP